MFAFLLAPQTVVWKTRLVWPCPKIILPKSNSPKVQGVQNLVSGEVALASFLNSSIYFIFHISPFWLRSWKHLWSTTGKHLLKASFTCHWGSSLPVYYVPCRRESGFLRNHRPHLNKSTRTEEGLAVMFLKGQTTAVNSLRFFTWTLIWFSDYLKSEQSLSKWCLYNVELCTADKIW